MLKRKETIHDIEAKIEEFNNNGRKTVVIFIDSYFPSVDGAISAVNNYSLRLMDRLNIMVCAPMRKGKITEQAYPVLGTKSIFLSSLNYDFALPKGDIVFEKTLKKLKIDLIHINSPFTLGQFAIDYAKKYEIPVMSTFHSQYRQDFYQATRSNFISDMMIKTIIKVFNDSDTVLTMNRFAGLVLNSYGYQGEISYLENGCDMHIPKNPKLLIDKINKKYELTDVKNVFLFVGRLVKVKNISFLLEVASILKNKNIDFRLLIIGGGDYGNTLKRQAKKLELEDCIIFTGPIYDRDLLSSFYLRSNLFLFPSLYDTDGIVKVEAAAYYTPSVVIQGCGAAQTIINGKNGFITENSPEQFARTVIHAIETDLEQIAENAHADLFVSWESVCEKLYSLYMETLFAHETQSLITPKIKQRLH